MSTRLTGLTLSESQEGIRSRKFSARELVDEHIKLIEETRHLNAYVLETPELAIEAAEKTDKRVASGNSLLPLDGIPIGVKDSFCTKGVRTTACSLILKKFVPPYESTVTSKLWLAGAGMLGKLNMDEFSMGSSCLTSCFGPVKSPWKNPNSDKDYVPGGSSGGSSSAVACGSAMASIGADTGGSVRQPASYTGVVGVRPTYGRCSRFGLIAFSPSFDQAGPIAKDVMDAAHMLYVMSGYDPKDAMSLQCPVPFFEKLINGNIDGLVVGIPRELYVEGISPDVIKALDQGLGVLKEAGAKVIDVSLPNAHHALATYYILTSAEASSTLSRYDGVRYGHRSSEARDINALYEQTRSEGFGKEVKRRILVGTYILSSDFYESHYLKAQKVRRMIVNDFKKAFEQVDVLVSPTTPTPPFTSDIVLESPLEMYKHDIMTVPQSLAGLPAISVPITLSRYGLPLSLQVTGSPLDEERILNVAFVIERGVCFPKLYRSYSQ